MSETVTYSVPAIHCAHCAMSIREEVSEVEGVEDVAVDLDTKVVTVQRPRARRRARCAPRSSRRVTRRPDRTCPRRRHPRRPQARRPRARRHDVRRVRDAHRAQAEQARRGRGVRQLRHRAGGRPLRPGAGRRRRADRRSRGGRLPREARRRGGRGEGPLGALSGCGSSSRRCSRRRSSLLAMIPPLRFEGWEWVALVLATPVVFWAGWGFHRAALMNARHGAATMDTLISIGTLAAWGWSVVALVVPGRRRDVLRGRSGDHDAHPPRPLPRGPRPAPLGRRDPRAPRDGRQGGARAPRRRGGVDPDRRA